MDQHFGLVEIVFKLLATAAAGGSNERARRGTAVPGPSLPAMAAATIIDCLVIGAGPAGLTAAVYLARYRRVLRVIDSGESRARLIPKTHNYPGFKGVAGEEPLQRLREQALQYDVAPEQGTVTELRRNEAGVFSAVSGGNTLHARSIILAAGILDRGLTST